METAIAKRTVTNTSKKKAKPFFKPLIIQKKLSIGVANDAYENEANHIADQVVNMPYSQIKTQTGALIQRKCTMCTEEERLQKKPLAKHITPLIQKSAIGNRGESVVSDAVSSKINSAKGGGSIMGDQTRNFMESRFGSDFSKIKIHTDSNAIQLSRQLNAQAFTVGNDIYFNEGKYQPNSNTGKHLLAHELTHTVQQAKVKRKIVQRATKDKKCAVQAYDSSNAKDKAVIPQKSFFEKFSSYPYEIGVSSVDNMVTKVNNYINSSKNKCECISKLEIRGHGTDGYQSVGNGSSYVNNNKALVYNSKSTHLKKLKKIKFCNRGMLMLTGCRTGRGKGKDLLKKVSNILPGILIGGAQHFTHDTGLGGVKVVGAGDKKTAKGNVADTSKSSSFIMSPYVNWHLTINGKEYIISGKDIKKAKGQSKLKAANKIKIITPEGELIKVK